MSTPFDLESAIFLNDLVEVFKISSSDITNKPFIEFISKFKKPILLSTGASSLEEINDATSWLDNGSSSFALMHCILNYPTQDNNANLSMITDLKNKFPGKIIGYSDHTLPNNMKNLEIATLLGAQILEKHFTHDKKLPGNDHYHSMDIKDLKIFIKRLNKLFNILGSNEKNYIPEEVVSRNNARRSLVANFDIEIGEKIKLSKLTWKRPASGISPKFINDIIDKKAQIKIKKDQIIKWDMIK
jgi:N-acetylneuraminate synthase